MQQCQGDSETREMILLRWSVCLLGVIWRKLWTDPRAALLHKVDFAKVKFETCLRTEDGGKITGEEKLLRLKAGGGILLGHSAYFTLRNETGLETLEWIHKKTGATTLDFFGTTVRKERGKQGWVLQLRRVAKGVWLDPAKPLRDKFDRTSVALVLPTE